MCESPAALQALRAGQAGIVALSSAAGNQMRSLNPENVTGSKVTSNLGDWMTGLIDFRFLHPKGVLEAWVRQRASSVYTAAREWQRAPRFPPTRGGKGDQERRCAHRLVPGVFRDRLLLQRVTDKATPLWGVRWGHFGFGSLTRPPQGQRPPFCGFYSAARGLLMLPTGRGSWLPGAGVPGREPLIPCRACSLARVRSPGPAGFCHGSHHASGPNERR